MSDLKSRLSTAIGAAHEQHRATPVKVRNFGGGFLCPDDPQTRQAAVLVACLAGQSPSVVLTVRSQGVPEHAGQVALPGGRYHPGEIFPEHTALREAHEEVGLEPAGAEVLGVLPPVATLTGFVVTPVVAWVATPTTLAPQEREVRHVFCRPLTEILNPARYSTHRLSLPGEGGVSVHRIWRLQGERWPIWGATAKILAQLASA